MPPGAGGPPPGGAGGPPPAGPPPGGMEVSAADKKAGLDQSIKTLREIIARSRK